MDIFLEIAHKSVQRVYLFQNWGGAQSYWVVLFAKTANAIGLLPEPMRLACYPRKEIRAISRYFQIPRLETRA